MPFLGEIDTFSSVTWEIDTGHYLCEADTIKYRDLSLGTAFFKFLQTWTASYEILISDLDPKRPNIYIFFFFCVVGGGIFLVKWQLGVGVNCDRINLVRFLCIGESLLMVALRLLMMLSCWKALAESRLLLSHKVGWLIKH